MVDCNQFGSEVRGGGASAVGLPDQCRGRGVRRQLEPARAAGRDVRQSPLLQGAAGRLEEGIASNILADRLKRLVSAGLLTREDAGPGRRAAYSLTEASIQLVPVFAQLGEWGLHHRPTTKRLRVRAELLAVGGPELWREFMAELRTVHLGEPAPERDGPSVSERLAEAYAAAL